MDVTTVLVILLCVGIFLIAFPYKNWRILKNNSQKQLLWDHWLSKRPSKNEYLRLNNQSNPELISCDYCGETRQLPSLEMVIPSGIKFGIISNRYDKFFHYKSYICSQCGSDLYREKYEG